MVLLYLKAVMRIQIDCIRIRNIFEAIKITKLISTYPLKVEKNFLFSSLYLTLEISYSFRFRIS